MKHKEYWKGKPNSEKIIIDLCGGTGAWSKPYKDAGYDVRVITLPHHDIFEYTEYRKFINNVYGILAAPPCTHFSLARSRAKTPRDLKKAFRSVERCLEIIYDCRLNGKLVFWALENPRAFLRQIIGKPPLTFNPCDYGDTYTKVTDLWGYYNMPRVWKGKGKPPTHSFHSYPYPPVPKGYVIPDDMKRQQVRKSITSRHLAKAFFKANR